MNVNIYCTIEYLAYSRLIVLNMLFALGFKKIIFFIILMQLHHGDDQVSLLCEKFSDKTWNKVILVSVALFDVFSHQVVIVNKLENYVAGHLFLRTLWSLLGSYPWCPNFFCASSWRIFKKLRSFYRVFVTDCNWKSLQLKISTFT